MRSLCNAALALALVCAQTEALPQLTPPPGATQLPPQQLPVPSTGDAVPLLLPAPAAGESLSHAKPQGIYATINLGGMESQIRHLGQLIPTPRREAITAAIANAPALAPPVLYALANAISQDDDRIADAVFWFHVGRIRAVYDGLRCKDASARGEINVLGKGLSPDIGRYQRQHRQQTLQIAELAIKWDQEHPRNYDHRWINLYGKVAHDSEGTDPSEPSVPESEWPALLQRVHEAHLKSVQEFAAGK